MLALFFGSLAAWCASKGWEGSGFGFGVLAAIPLLGLLSLAFR